MPQEIQQTATAVADCREIFHAINKLFGRALDGPATAYFEYLDGIEVRRATYVAYSLQAVEGRDMVAMAVGAIQNSMNDDRHASFESSTLAGWGAARAVVWRCRPTFEPEGLYFRIASIPVHVKQMILREAD